MIEITYHMGEIFMVPVRVFIVKDEGDCRVVYNVDAFCYIFRQRSFLDRGRNKFLVSIVCDRYKEVFGLQTSIFVAEYES